MIPIEDSVQKKALTAARGGITIGFIPARLRWGNIRFETSSGGKRGSEAVPLRIRFQRIAGKNRTGKGLSSGNDISAKRFRFSDLLHMTFGGEI